MLIINSGGICERNQVSDEKLEYSFDFYYFLTKYSKSDFLLAYKHIYLRITTS